MSEVAMDNNITSNKFIFFIVFFLKFLEYGMFSYPFYTFLD